MSTSGVHTRTILLVATILTLALGASATPLPASASETAAPLIVIDPGHGGRYSNANANGLREKTVNLRISRMLRDELVARGYRVRMTRNSDRAVELRDIPTWNYRSKDGTWRFAKDGRRGYAPSIPKDDLQARVNYANARGADLFISVHANGAYSKRARGYETFSARRDPRGRSLSKVVQRAVISRTRLRDRGAKYADFHVLRWANMPAILVECGFITNRGDAWLLKQSWFRRRMARSMADGVDRWMKANPPRRLYPRVSGASATGFSESIARVGITTPTPAAVVARADDWASIPGAATLAVTLNAPLLLTSESELCTDTAQALNDLAPSRVVLIDAQGTPDETVTASFAAASSLSTEQITVIATDSPSALSALIASEAPIPGPRRVFIVDSGDTASMLAAAPVAALLRAPLLVAERGLLATSAAEYLVARSNTVAQVVLVGATTSLPTRIAGGLPVRRHAPASASDLLVTLNAAYTTRTVTTSSRPVVSNARSGPGFLVSAVRAARVRQPLIGVESRVLPTRTRLWITNRRSLISGFEVHDPDGTVPLLMDSVLRKVEYY